VGSNANFQREMLFHDFMEVSSAPLSSDQVFTSRRTTLSWRSPVIVPTGMLCSSFNKAFSRTTMVMPHALACASVSARTRSACLRLIKFSGEDGLYVPRRGPLGAGSWPLRLFTAALISAWLPPQHGARARRRKGRTAATKSRKKVNERFTRGSCASAGRPGEPSGQAKGTLGIGGYTAATMTG